MIGEWLLEPGAGRLSCAEQSVTLRPQLVELLLSLTRRAGSVVSKQELIEQVWNGRSISESALTRAITELRHALGDSIGEPRYIETIPKRGYRLLAATSPALAAEPNTCSLAVVPFANLTGDAGVEPLCSGLAEEIIHSLSQVPGIAVVARTSAFAVCDQVSDIREVGRKLGVRYVLEGSIRRSQSRLRVAVQMVDSRDGLQTWSQRFEVGENDAFTVEDEISIGVVEYLKLRLEPEASARLLNRLPARGEAQTLTRMGRFVLGKRTPGSRAEAQRLFEEAIKHDPAYAPAWAGMAEGEVLAAFLGFDIPGRALPRARDAARNAIRLDAGCGEAYTALGWSLATHERDYTAGLQALRRGVELSPGSSLAHYWLGIILGSVRRLDEAWQEFSLALALDPLSLAMRSNAGLLLFWMGRYHESLASFRHILMVEPAFPLALVHGSRVLSQLGQHEEAIEWAGKVAATGFLAGIGAFGYVLGRAGEVQRAREVLEQLTQLSRQRYVNPFLMAAVHAGLGELEPACEWLEVSARDSDPMFAMNFPDPSFGPVHEHPRFQQILARYPLPDGQSL